MDVQARTEVSQSWQVPYKEYDGWHTRCPERVQPLKCFTAGEHKAQMAALDMAGEVSSVAARHCSLPLQCKCASSGDHLKQVGLATAAHCNRSSRPQWSGLHQSRASWHCFEDNGDYGSLERPVRSPSPNVQPSVTSITACASDSQDDEFLDIARVLYPMHPTEHRMCIPHPTNPASLHPMHPRAIYRHPTRPTSPASHSSHIHSTQSMGTIL